MSVTKTPVLFQLAEPFAGIDELAELTIYIELIGFETRPGGTVVPQTWSGSPDASGEVTVDLPPNGDRGSHYAVAVYRPGGNRPALRTRIVVPESATPVNFRDIIATPPPAKSAAQLAQEAAQQAAADSINLAEGFSVVGVPQPPGTTPAASWDGGTFTLTLDLVPGAAGADGAGVPDPTGEAAGQVPQTDGADGYTLVERFQAADVSGLDIEPASVRTPDSEGVKYYLGNSSSGIGIRLTRPTLFLNGTPYLRWSTEQVQILRPGGLHFNDVNLLNTQRVILVAGVGVLMQRDGTNPQEYQLYRTYTDPSNYGRAALRFSGDDLQLGAEAAGTGPATMHVDLLAHGDGQIRAAAPLAPPSYTVATVPDATLHAGAYIDVADEAGGPVLARSDGADWRRLTDLAVIS